MKNFQGLKNGLSLLCALTLTFGLSMSAEAGNADWGNMRMNSSRVNLGRVNPPRTRECQREFKQSQRALCRENAAARRTMSTTERRTAVRTPSTQMQLRAFLKSSDCGCVDTRVAAKPVFLQAKLQRQLVNAQAQFRPLANCDKWDDDNSFMSCK
jgi:hypothetical protein